MVTKQRCLYLPPLNRAMKQQGLKTAPLLKIKVGDTDSPEPHKQQVGREMQRQVESKEATSRRRTLHYYIRIKVTIFVDFFVSWSYILLGKVYGNQGCIPLTIIECRKWINTFVPADHNEISWKSVNSTVQNKTARTSLVMQWLRLILWCRGPRFDLWSGN